VTQPLRLEYVDADSLSANPSNWRRHDATQRAAFDQALGQVGWVKPIIFNEATGQLVDGHMRREQCAGQTVPVVIGSWTVEQERTILLTLDPMSAQADFDKTAFAELLGQCDATGSDLIALLSATADMVGLYKGLGEAGDDPDVGDPGEGEAPEAPLGQGESLTRADVPDTVFPSANEWGVPDLLAKLQAVDFNFPVTQWGTQAAGKPMQGTWSFYVDDRRFERLWNDPSPVTRAGCVAVIEPNFSTHEQLPRALVLWRIYQKRWLARWWQSKGLRVYVDLNVDPAFADLALIGVPIGWKAYATRAHEHGKNIEAQHDQAVAHAGSEDIHFLVYGGGMAVETLCGTRGWKWIPEQFDEAKKRIKASRPKKGPTDGRNGK
jgi:hypothetical protein